MRRTVAFSTLVCSPLVALAVAWLPAVAEAHPYPILGASFLEPAELGSEAAQPTQPSESSQPATNPQWQPTSSKAPPSGELQEIEPEPEPEVEVEPEPMPEVEPEPLRTKAPEAFNRNAIGIVGGLTIIPTFIVDNYVASMTNALCRGDSVPTANYARNLNRVGGCNFHVGAEYVRRVNKNFDVAPQIGYQRVKAPDGLWLDRDECPGGDGSEGCNYGAADYTQVDLSFLYVAVDLIGRATLVKTPEFEWQLGGGGGLGLGIISGIGSGLYQTPLGSKNGGPGSPDGDGNIQSTCSSFGDFADFNRCTPRWHDEASDENGGPSPTYGDLRLDRNSPNVGRFAECTRDTCNEGDLNALGRRRNTDVPPVIPYFKLMVSTRFIIKDTFGINIQGGWNTGFFFGGSLQYFFGPK